MTDVIRLIGFGTTVVPHPPYRIDRLADAPETTLLVASSDQSVIIDVRDALRGADTGGLIDVQPGDARQTWRIVTNVCSCAWPYDFGVSSDPDGLSSFLLLGPRETMVWIAGPIALDKASPIEKLAADDQTIRAVAEAEDASRIDLDYDLDGEQWWQRRYVVQWGDGEALVLTGQARAADEELTREAVDTLENTLAPAPSSEPTGS